MTLSSRPRSSSRTPYIVFHGKVHPAALGAADLSAFLSWLAEHQQVSASTRNQALSAVLFLYNVQELLGHRDVRTTTTYLYVLERGALGVKSPLDRL